MTRRAHLGAPPHPPPVTYRWQHVHSSSIQSCSVYTEGPLTDAACPEGPSIYDRLPDITAICVFIMCLTSTFGQTREPASSTPRGWGGGVSQPRWILFCGMLKQDWNSSLFLPHIHALAAPIIIFLLIINHTMISAPPIIKGNYSRPRLQHLRQGGNAFFPVPLFKSESDTINQSLGHI